MSVLAFVHTPKTGGSSIRETYKGTLVYADKGEKNLHVHMPLDAIDDPFDVSFAVVREPKQWLHSLWTFTKTNRNAQWLDRFATFESFIVDGGIEKVKTVLGNNTQSEWTEGVDEFILFENLEEGLNKLLETHNIEIKPLPHLKKTAKKEIPKISEEAEKILNEHLKNDYILYNRILTQSGDKSETR